MEFGLALEIWAASLAVAGAVGWIIGDRRGAADLALAARDEEGEELREGLFTLTIPPLHPPVGNRSCVTATGEDNDIRMSQTRHTPKPRVLGEGASPARGCGRSEIFAAMPPIAELEEQVREIRLTDAMWTKRQMSEQLAEFLDRADFASLEVLSQYRKVVDDLNVDYDKRLPDAPAHFLDGSCDAPVLKAAAPIDVQAFFERLSREAGRELPSVLAAQR